MFDNYGNLATNAQERLFPVLVHIVAPLNGKSLPAGANIVAHSLRPGSINGHVEVLKSVNHYLQTILLQKKVSLDNMNRVSAESSCLHFGILLNWDPRVVFL